MELAAMTSMAALIHMNRMISLVASLALVMEGGAVILSTVLQHDSVILTIFFQYFNYLNIICRLNQSLIITIDVID